MPNVGELAGFEQGDILIELNGEEVINSFSVLRETLKAFPGDVWYVTVLRGEELLTIEVALSEMDIQSLRDIITQREKNRGGK